VLDNGGGVLISCHGWLHGLDLNMLGQCLLDEAISFSQSLLVLVSSLEDYIWCNDG
jgi:hypothetical protein